MTTTKASTSNTTISPEYIPGFTHLMKECIIGFIALSALFTILHIPGNTIVPAAEYCNEESNTYPPSCKRPDIFAFEGVCGTIFIIMTYLSIKSWHIDQHPQSSIPQTPIGRVYGYSSQCEKVAAISFIFQLWSCFVTPFIPEFYSTIMMTHHIMATLVSYLALQYQYYHYYTIFFLALSEVSSVPLVFMSLGKYFPTSIFNVVVPVAQPLFALTFTFYRVYMWNKISINLWSDAMIVLKKKKKRETGGKESSCCIAEEYRPGMTFCLYIFLSINVLLGLLQLFWFTKILKELLKVLGIDWFNDVEHTY